MTFEDFKKHQGGGHPFYVVDPSDPWSSHKMTWNAAVEQTKQACIESIDILVGADGYVCVHPDEIKNVLMQVEVE